MSRDVAVVRKGKHLELHIDGACSSVSEGAGGEEAAVWAAMAMGLLGLPRYCRRSVLILGLCAGSVARVVRAVAPEARIVGVEMDPAVIRTARRWFGLDKLGVTVVKGDARQVVHGLVGSFDLVIEDLFVGPEWEIKKPAGVPVPLVDHCKRLMRPGGIFVSNTIEEGPAVRRALDERFRRVVEIAIEDLDNRIYIGGQSGLVDAKRMRMAAGKLPAFAEALNYFKLRNRHGQ